MQAAKSLSLGSTGRLAAVVGFHVALVYLIATSLGIIHAPLLTEPMTATLLSDPQQAQPVKPDIVKPDLVEPTLEIPEPDMLAIPEVEVPVDVASSAMSGAISDAVESAELTVTNRVAPVYPHASMQAGEEGVVIFRVLVDEKGKPLQVNVMRSSGFSRLDNAAAQALKKWTFAPATRDSQPVKSWSRVQVKFQLKS